MNASMQTVEQISWLRFEKAALLMTAQGKNEEKYPTLQYTHTVPGIVDLRSFFFLMPEAAM